MQSNWICRIEVHSSPVEKISNLDFFLLLGEQSPNRICKMNGPPFPVHGHVELYLGCPRSIGWMKIIEESVSINQRVKSAPVFDDTQSSGWRKIKMNFWWWDTDPFWVVAYPDLLRGRQSLHHGLVRSSSTR